MINTRLIDSIESPRALESALCRRGPEVWLCLPLRFLTPLERTTPRPGEPLHQR